MQTQSGVVPLEIVAAITAAIAVVLEQPLGSFAITRIEPHVQPQVRPPSAWAKVGLIESHLARGQFGLRTR
jgi:hypothetical protein